MRVRLRRLEGGLGGARQVRGVGGASRQPFLGQPLELHLELGEGRAVLGLVGPANHQEVLRRHARAWKTHSAEKEASFLGAQGSSLRHLPSLLPMRTMSAVEVFKRNSRSKANISTVLLPYLRALEKQRQIPSKVCTCQYRQAFFVMNVASFRAT